MTLASSTSVLHHESLVINALDYTYERNFTHEYVDLLRVGGIDALSITVPSPEDDFRQAVTHYGQWRRRLLELGDRVAVVRRAGDILRAQREGKVAIILGCQNGKALDDDIGLIDVFHRLDIRIIQLTYNHRNYIGNGVLEQRDDGLSTFGLAIVRELNRAGIVIDLSHAGEHTAVHAVEASEDPVIVSHTAAQALCGHFRCISDRLIRTVASRGGCIGVAALSIFLRADGRESGAGLDDYLDHMEHMIEVGGIDHVGIGFDMGYKLSDEDLAHIRSTYPDFNLPPMHLQYPPELDRADKAPNVTAGLVDRGYSEDKIQKLLGLNWHRVFATVWGE